ncbi:hypothetical protein GGD38_000527 [Chitinophagaceae bacterium OAS944]|nr:hypothetical protein [Chitinophagaceae bacterium OAS944]
MHMVLWYVAAGHKPSVNEAIEKLNYLRKNGETPLAFTFKKRFTAEEAVSYQAIS